MPAACVELRQRAPRVFACSDRSAWSIICSVIYGGIYSNICSGISYDICSASQRLHATGGAAQAGIVHQEWHIVGT